MAKFIKAAGLPVIVDRAVGLEPRLRPGDITLPRWQGVSPLYVDITISHPLALSTHWNLMHTAMEYSVL